MTCTNFYRDMLLNSVAFLGIDCIEIRRLRYDLVFVYKLLFGFADLTFSNYFTLTTGSTTHCHNTNCF